MGWSSAPHWSHPQPTSPKKTQSSSRSSMSTGIRRRSGRSPEHTDGSSTSTRPSWKEAQQKMGSAKRSRNSSSSPESMDVGSCALTATGLRLKGSRSSTGESCCRHDVCIGDTCRRCGVVGGAGPGFAEGQIWAARGGDHWEHVIASLLPDHIVLLNPKGKLVVIEDAENLRDEFFYVGSIMDPVEDLVLAAKAHGEQSEPGMEAGDLTAVIYAAWCIMTPEQRERLLGQPEVKEVLEWSEQ